MQITPYLVTYDGMSYFPHLATVARFLIDPECDFGVAVDEVEIFAHVETEGFVNKELDFMRVRFQERLITLPKIWFRRKRRLIEIAYQSRMSESDLKAISEARFAREFFTEMTSALTLINKRISKSDEFHLDNFLSGVSRGVRRFENLNDFQILELMAESRNNS